MTRTDSVDAVLRGWRDTGPSLDVTPVAIVLRLGRIRSLMEGRMEAVMSRHGLTLGDFSGMAAIARLEGDDGVSQARLMGELGLTSGTVSVRIDRLVGAGRAIRAADPADRRGARVRLTPEGRRVFEAAAPEHLANERDMLRGLSSTQQQRLADLLRPLPASLEASGA